MTVCRWLALCLFLSSLAPAQGEPLPLHWIAPTENVDGSPLTDLAGFQVYWGDQPGDYNLGTEYLADQSLTSHTLEVAPGTYFVAMSAWDADGNESDLSNELVRTVAAGAPGNATLAATAEWARSEMTWTYIGHSSDGNDGEPSGIITLTHGLGASIQAGDLLLLSVHTNFNMGADGPPDPEPHTNALESDGWTYPLQNGEAAGESMANWVGYKVATANEPAFYSFDMKISTFWGMHLYVARPGAGLSWAYDLDSGLTSTGSAGGTNPIAESITLSQDDSIAFALVGHDAGTANIISVDNDYINVSVDNIRGNAAYRIFATAGPTGDTTFIADTSNRGDYAFHIGFHTVSSPDLVNVDSIAQAQVLDVAQLVHTNLIDPANLVQLQALEEVSVSSEAQISPVDMSQAQVFDAADLIQTNVVAPEDLIQLQVLDAVTVGQENQIQPLDIEQLQALEVVTLAPEDSVIVEGMHQQQLLDAAQLVQTNVISPLPMFQDQNLETVMILVAGTLVTEDIAQLQELDAVVLAQENQLDPESMVQLQVFQDAAIAIPSDYIAPGRAVVIAPRDRALLVAERLRAMKARRT